MSNPVKKEAPQKRHHYRVGYTEYNCPYFLFNGKTFSVLDVSEKGIRFSLGNAIGLNVGDSLSGSVHFPGMETVILRGIVGRINENEISLSLLTEIPLRIIVAEQRRLTKKFEKFE